MKVWTFLLVISLLLLFPQTATTQADPITDYYISPQGSDEADGLSPDTAFRTISAAWSRIPADSLTTGYHIHLLPGEYPCEGDCINFFGDRAGTADYPIILSAEPNSVTLLGGLNLARVTYLTVANVTLRAGDGAPLWGNNVFHCDACDHLTVSGVTMVGPTPHPDNYDIQEVIKVNQADDVVFENNDISGTYQTGVDFVAVRHGVFRHNRVHDTGEWCMYAKGGSAYLTIEGNEFYNCGLGFQAGEGTNFEIMEAPYLQYETYDVKFINNLLHDIPGTALGVSGSYNTLLAYNTLYRVGTFNDGSGRGYPLVRLVQGGRVCLDFSENGEGNGEAVCGDLLAQGGWGTATVGFDFGGEWIPNRNVYVYNNLFYNPDAATLYSHFEIYGPHDLPENAVNIPNPSYADENVQIRGNVIWNGSAEMPLGVEDAASGCQASNPTCNAAQLRAENQINGVVPSFVNAEAGDFHLTTPLPVTLCPLPDFAWDVPVPEGTLSNGVPQDMNGVARTCGGNVGALE